MKYLLIAILLLGACSAQYFNQEEVEASFENDFGDLDAMTKDMDFDEENLLEDAQDEEDPFDLEDLEDDEEDMDLPEEAEFDDEDFDFENYDPSMDFLEDGEEEDFDGEDMEDMTPEEAFFWRRVVNTVRRVVHHAPRVVHHVKKQVTHHASRAFHQVGGALGGALQQYGPRALEFAKKYGPKAALLILRHAVSFIKCKRDVVQCGTGLKTFNIILVKRGCLSLC